MFRDLVADSAQDLPPRRIIVSDETMLGPSFRTDGFGLYPCAYRSLVALHGLPPDGRVTCGACKLDEFVEVFVQW